MDSWNRASESWPVCGRYFVDYVVVSIPCNLLHKPGHPAGHFLFVPEVGRIVYGLVKVQRGNCAPWFQVVNLAWATVPWDAEILCRDEEYVILKVTREWCISETRAGREVTHESFEDA